MDKLEDTETQFSNMMDDFPEQMYHFKSFFNVFKKSKQEKYEQYTKMFIETLGELNLQYDSPILKEVLVTFLKKSSIKYTKSELIDGNLKHFKILQQLYIEARIDAMIGSYGTALRANRYTGGYEHTPVK